MLQSAQAAHSCCIRGSVSAQVQYLWRRPCDPVPSNGLTSQCFEQALLYLSVSLEPLLAHESDEEEMPESESCKDALKQLAVQQNILRTAAAAAEILSAALAAHLRLQPPICGRRR